MAYTRTPIADVPAYDLDAAKLHARIDDYYDDSETTLIAATAVAEVEAYADIALLAQTVTATLEGCAPRTALPVGPLWGDGLEDHPIAVQARDCNGELTDVNSGWWVEQGRFPVIHFSQAVTANTIIVTYPAGYGQMVADIPADIQLAVNDHASRLYDLRGPADAPQGLSLAAARIMARHRRVRV